MKIENGKINDLIFAGGNIGPFTVTASVLSAWMWVTSVLGSSEAYSIYGISGSVAYVLGACISFAALIPILTVVRRHTGRNGTCFNIISRKCSPGSMAMFYLFSVCVAAYVLIEQAVGIASLCSQAFGSSFKMIGFFSVMIATFYVVICGMRGLLKLEIAAFLVIIAGFFIMIFELHHTGQLRLKFISTFDGGTLAVFSKSALRYFFMAIIIAFSQILLDPAWYIKSKMSASENVMKFSFSLSGVFLWGIISFFTSFLIGPFINNHISAVFIVIIGFIAIGTIADYMIGIMGIFTVNFYADYLKPGATEGEMILFGRVMTIVIGILCGLVAISLEGISLLTIDMFCAVFFAAVCMPFVFVILKKTTGKEKAPIFGRQPIMAVAGGLIAGFILWTSGFIPAAWQDIAGTLASFTVSMVIMLVPVDHGRAEHDSEAQKLPAETK